MHSTWNWTGITKNPTSLSRTAELLTSLDEDDFPWLPLNSTMTNSLVTLGDQLSQLQLYYLLCV